MTRENRLRDTTPAAGKSAGGMQKPSRAEQSGDRGEPGHDRQSIMEFGAMVFGSPGNFQQWLGTGVMSLGGERPGMLMETADGRDAVRAVLLKLHFGLY